VRARLLRGFLLDDVLVEPLAGCVTSRDKSSHLPPKSVDVLLELALKPGTLVTHEELLVAVWGSEQHNHEVLTRAISELRHALGDHYNNPTFIQTVPRRGYRLLVKPRLSPHVNKEENNDGALVDVPPFFRELMRRKVVQTGVAYLVVSWLLVQVADTAFDNLGLPWWSAPFITVLVVTGFPIALALSWFMEFAGGKLQVDETNSSPYINKSGIAYIAVLGALVISAGALGMYRLFNEDDALFGTSPEQSSDWMTLPAELDIPVLPNSIAVLRFINIGGNSSFSDGLSENLLHLLTSLPELSVPSRTSAWGLSSEGIPSTQIAKRLHVRYVLEGSVQQVENNIRVTAQLIDGRSGHHLWSENYDRQLSAREFFAILDDIARRVAERLQMSLSLESSAVLSRARTSNTEALEFYLLGMEQLRKPKSDESLGRAVEAFGEAARIDAHFTEAYAGLCEGYLAWYVMTHDTEYFQNAEKSCLRTLTLDDSLGEVYAAMGSLHRYAGRYDEAQIELEKAIELLPYSASVLEELGRVYRAQDKLSLAEKTFFEAIMQEPSSWSVYKSFGNFLFRTGRYEEALPLYRYVVELAPEHAPGYNNLGVTYYMLGRFEEAATTWDHIIDDAPTRATLMNYANSLYYQYEFERSAQMYESALEMAPNDYRIWESLAGSLRHMPGGTARENEAMQHAIELAQETLHVNPKDQMALSRVSLLYIRSGEMERAGESIAKLRKLGWDDPDVSFTLALILLETGDREGALEELVRAVEMGFPAILIAADPDFEELRQAQRFVALMENTKEGETE